MTNNIIEYNHVFPEVKHSDINNMIYEMSKVELFEFMHFLLVQDPRLFDDALWSIYIRAHAQMLYVDPDDPEIKNSYLMEKCRIMEEFREWRLDK